LNIFQVLMRGLENSYCFCLLSEDFCNLFHVERYFSITDIFIILVPVSHQRNH
jgi:hypothetical protein